MGVKKGRVKGGKRRRVMWNKGEGIKGGGSVKGGSRVMGGRKVNGR